MKWHDLLAKYNLQENSWINNMFKFREKWATVYRRDSFSGDMTSTQRSEGMNNVFKKTFRGRLSLSELLEKVDKCAVRLRRKEKYEDFKSRHSDPVICIRRHPLLKAAAASYTRTLYSFFEEEFQRQFTLSCTLLSSETTTNTYKVTSFFREDKEAIVVFNPTTLDISCSCKLYGCVGMHKCSVHHLFNYELLRSTL
jgi:zinc finger SWIM domain-containing protein 3